MNNITNKSCYICKKKLVGNNFCLDHDHMTGVIRGFAHAEFDKNFRIPKLIPFVMHNLSKYDSYLFLRELVPNNGILDSAEGFVLFY